MYIYNIYIYIYICMHVYISIHIHTLVLLVVSSIFQSGELAQSGDTLEIQPLGALRSEDLGAEPSRSFFFKIYFNVEIIDLRKTRDLATY